MPHCQGNGQCLEECSCRCFDRRHQNSWKFCVCGHANHESSCVPTRCEKGCTLKPCFNYRFCDVKTSQRVLNNYNGLCIYCWKYFGKIFPTNNFKKCTMCQEEKMVLNTKFKIMEICFECFEDMVDNSPESLIEHDAILRYVENKENFMS